jgi:hypothetical protein
MMTVSSLSEFASRLPLALRPAGTTAPIEGCRFAPSIFPSWCDRIQIATRLLSNSQLRVVNPDREQWHGIG